MKNISGRVKCLDCPFIDDRRTCTRCAPRQSLKDEYESAQQWYVNENEWLRQRVEELEAEL